ncbi:uncharacterized protein PHALS_05802 [Plasmopara halstedii]|uniref:Uncharacterized protein n=1 Tax=Plasmopara halstedii TaxID=4781 RepID=A0A0N7L457_PLAHL|nr:uncharacterized protein PHALS_05802 [Plasmopara halstedii]CEG37747.1 hypothetical protein PHALS_05802 [Plasmopara halstedii]|eukprot:XP_024574116.1 hypothetical protein PHALS_05802 [Plasmopara halstedii]
MFDIHNKDLNDVHKSCQGRLIQSRSFALSKTDDDRVEHESDDFHGHKDREATSTAFEQNLKVQSRFIFRKLQKTSGDMFLDAMRRKRRMLGRNENLRFRELYKPPEPVAVIFVIVVGLAVTLILTKSWPFFS